MAASISIELESGTSAGRVHPHNGYYAGDFGAVWQVAPAAWGAPIARSTPSCPESYTSYLTSRAATTITLTPVPIFPGPDRPRPIPGVPTCPAPRRTSAAADSRNPGTAAEEEAADQTEQAEREDR